MGCWYVFNITFCKHGIGYLIASLGSNFIPSFSTVAAPLTGMATFAWGKEQAHAWSELKHLIQTSGVFSTVRLAMIKYRSTISIHFPDFNIMGLETQEELDELVAVTNNDYLVQANR